MKKILTFLMVCLCCSAIGQEVLFESNGIVYGVTSEEGRSVEVENYGYLLNSGYSGAITIPQTVEYEGETYTVTALGASAFESCTGVTSLSLPATIRSIGAYCFYNCSFTSLQLPDSLRSLGDQAFLYSNVTSLHLPAKFEEYGEATFWARNLTSITVDEENPRYRSIDGWLYSKDSLTLCIVPDGVSGVINVPTFVRHLGRQVFGFNANATSVSLPEGLVSIGNFAFNCCSAVNNIVIPSTVTRIGICPFSYCPQLTNLGIADGNSHYVLDGLMLYSAGYDTLVSCHKSGETVTVNPNVKVLGGFENNTWVKNISIPAGVTDILDNCFSGCTFTSIALPAHMKSIGVRAFAENNYLTSVTMPQTLQRMGEKAFAWCMKLTSIAIPDSLKVIPAEAFNSDPRLASITWGNAVEEIGEGAFWAMKLTSLDLPATLKKIGDGAFGACQSFLERVTVRSQLDTIGSHVFTGANIGSMRFAVGLPPATTGHGALSEAGRLDSIIIPCGSMDAWLADEYWGQYGEKYVEDCGMGIRKDSLGQPSAVSVYPNPTSGQLHIGAGNEKITAAEIYDTRGGKHKVSSTSEGIDLSNLPAGVYYLILSTDKGTSRHKVVKID
ncbi:MAG: leucine-rich repeat protein [Bacteroidales bacterium]|nr:leucine-rich repeat protein [Bacteroidales bacterium]